MLNQTFRCSPLFCQDLATKKLREHPTLPSDDKLEAVDHGELWPRAFCAFVGCPWVAMHGNEGELHAHLQAAHADDLAPIAARMLRGNAPDAFLSIYNEAIAVKCRSQAPIAGPSIDRRAVKSFGEACEGHKVEALVCFVCACTYTYVEELAGEGKGDVEWVHPFKHSPDEEKLLFLDRPIDETGDLLNLKTFLDRYDKVSEVGNCLQDHESFSDWSLRWPSNAALPVGRRILCCPEDPFFAPVCTCKNKRESLQACTCSLRVKESARSSLARAPPKSQKQHGGLDSNGLYIS